MDRKIRRSIVVAGGALFAMPLAALAQGPAKPWKIGFLTNGTVASAKPQIDAFVAGMKEQGYVEGRDFLVESRWAEGKLDRVPVLAGELAALKPHVIFAPSGVAAGALRKSGTAVPIVFAFVPDPVGQGFAASLARPGGTMSGLTSTHTELSAKRIELLKEVLPALRRVAVLYFRAPSAAGVEEQLAETERAAKLLGVSVLPEQSAQPEDFERAFIAMHKQRPDALIVIENPMFFTNRWRLAELAQKLGIPAVYNVSEYVHAGGLMSYGASYSDLARRAASYAVRILNGRPPGELPVERPTRFELALNMKTAKAIGLAIPQSVLMRADTTVS